jgi:hypothetical protein
LRSDRRARLQRRARDFGARRPRLSLIVICVLLAGATAVCGLQLSYGTYLGRGWVIAALAGMATAAVLSAAAVVNLRRHRRMGRLAWAWLVLGLASASAIRLPFPQGPYGDVSAFFNVVHAALLGCGAVTSAALFILLACQFPRLRGRAPGRPAQAPGNPLYVRELPASLRFPGTEAATWRAGRLIAAGGSVRWLSLNGDAEVDLTLACQGVLPSAAHSRQPPGDGAGDRQRPCRGRRQP